MQRALYAGGLLGIILFACEYEPEGLFEVNLPKPEIPAISIDLNVPPDTIWLEEYQEIRFSLRLNGKDFKYFEVKFNGQSIGYYHDSQTSGTIYLDPYAIPSGRYLLEFYVKTSTQSGSLADKLGAEDYDTVIAIPVVVDKALPSSEEATMSLNDTEAGLMLQWKVYTRKNFYAYILEARYGDNMGYQTLTQIDNSRQNTFKDVGYLGGKVEYRLTIMAVQGGMVYPFYGEPIIYDSPGISLTEFELKGDSLIQMAWNRAPRPHAFGAYLVICHSCSYFGEVEIARITDINDTTFAITDIPFGDEVFFSFRVESISNSFNGPIQFFYQQKSFRRGQPTFSAYLLRYKVASSSFYAEDNGTLFRIDENTLEKAAQIPVTVYGDFYNPQPYVFSSRGDHLYLSRNNRLEKINPATLQIDKVISTRTFFGYDAFLRPHQVSDNNRLLVHAYERVGGNFQVRSFNVLDMESEKIVLNIPIDFDWNDLYLSDNGRFLVWQREIFRLENDTINSLGYLPVSYGYNLSLHWPVDQSDAVWINDGNTINLYDLNTNSIVKTFPVATPLSEVVLDPATGLFSGLTSEDNMNYYRWYDPESGRMLREVKLWGGDISSANGILWSGTGYYMKINL